MLCPLRTLQRRYSIAAEDAEGMHAKGREEITRVLSEE